MIIMEGQGVGGHVGDESSLTPSIFLSFFFTMVSNGVDTMRFLCSALNVKVMEIETNARAHAAERDHEKGLSKCLRMCLCQCSCI